MDFVNKKVTHEIFGEGSVVKYNDSYIKIKFESGYRKFVYPDAFKDYIKFVDKKATNIINKEIKKKDAILKEIEEQEREERRKKEELRLKQQKLLQEEQEYISRQRRGSSVNSKIQSVFWCEEDEIDEIFTEWKVFTGEIQSGKNKGKPRRLARMNQNSACLLTRRDNDVPEKDRQILGVFLANESFDGRECEDGYITAHPKYRIHLSEDESEKMLFWNYYFDEKSIDEIVWNSGRQRYFDNIWMAQILRDIAILREVPEEQELAQDFFDHFCRINGINKDNLPIANGPLMRS